MPHTRTATVLATLAALALAGCGGAAAPVAVDTPTPTPAPVKATCALKSAYGMWTASGSVRNPTRDEQDYSLQFRVTPKSGDTTLTGYGAVQHVAAGTKAAWSGAVTDDTTTLGKGATCTVVQVIANPSTP